MTCLPIVGTVAVNITSSVKNAKLQECWESALANGDLSHQGKLKAYTLENDKYEK